MKRNLLSTGPGSDLLVLALSLSLVIGMTGCATPLIQASMSGDTNQVQALLDTGADVNEVVDGRTSLHWAAWYGHADMVRLLLDRGADVNKKDVRGQTPLMIAAERHKPQIVEILLQGGADLGAKDHVGATALHWAVYKGAIGSVSVLLDNGADPTVIAENGNTPLSLAVQYGYPNIVEMLKKALEERRLTATETTVVVPEDGKKTPSLSGQHVHDPTESFYEKFGIDPSDTAQEAFHVQKMPEARQAQLGMTTAAITPPSPACDVSKAWAVIIGISRYRHSGQNGLTNLVFADDDAKAFADVLYRLGWSQNYINLLINEAATKRNIEIALESWLMKAGPNDQIVLFWAGYGFPDPEDPEKVYFACYDTDISIPVTGYRMDRVRAALEERKSRHVILLADTCHAGKLITRSDRAISILPQIDRMRRERKVPKGWIFMVGADTDRQAIENTSWTNGAFTHSLVQGLTGGGDGYESMGPKDGVVTMGEMRAYMNTAMPDETQRVLGVAKRPVITASRGDSDIWKLTLQRR